ncbi:MAG: substrate-binding domain-containing protein [Rectinema sp.]
MKRLILAAALAAALFVAGVQNAASQSIENPRIKLATTTSTEQSGLLAYILPVFEKNSGYKVDVIAVGTGASLKIGEKGDCDVVLVHARALEDAFMASGFGADRKDVMYNDFILLGPASDPAGVASAKSATEAFARVASAKASFVSRGDNSGTHVKEKDVWKAAGISPAGSWYKEAGQGMSQVIIMAEQTGGYTLADRGTWLAMKDNVKLSILSQGDKVLFNPYGVITVNPAKWPKTNYAGAKALMEFLVSPKGQSLINSYKIGGEQCFYTY